MLSLNLSLSQEQMARPGLAELLGRLIAALGSATNRWGMTAVGSDAATMDHIIARRQAPSVEAEVAATLKRARKTAPAQPPKRAHAPKAPAPTRPAPTTWAEYEAGLPDLSRGFLTLLRERGRLSLSDAMDQLGITEAKGMGGLTGAMTRWAGHYGLTLPYEAATTDAGEREWVWLGEAQA